MCLWVACCVSSPHVVGLYRFSPGFSLINWTTLFCLINETSKFLLRV